MLQDLTLSLVNNVGLGNGLVLLSNKPLPEQMLCQFYITIRHL